MKKLFVILALVAALASLAAVGKGWKWGQARGAISTQTSDSQSDDQPDGQPDGWTWDGE